MIFLSVLFLKFLFLVFLLLFFEMLRSTWSPLHYEFQKAYLLCFRLFTNKIRINIEFKLTIELCTVTLLIHIPPKLIKIFVELLLNFELVCLQAELFCFKIELCCEIFSLFLTNFVVPKTKRKNFRSKSIIFVFRTICYLFTKTVIKTDFFFFSFFKLAENKDLLFFFWKHSVNIFVVVHHFSYMLKYRWIFFGIHNDDSFYV